ncbi:CHAT domain-containing tetratricopeptide repeat protein [Moorena sp. SIO3F7]|nr:CHAT domain-containing tetratricopeptide repeat protein [Moorena sp. SIO3F7]
MAENRSDSQLNFLLQVIQATEDSRGNKQVVYPLLATNIDQLNHKLAEKLQAWATTTLAEAEADEAEYYAAVIVLFSMLIQELPLGDKASNIEIVITGYKVALTVFTREAFPQFWASTQYNIGNVYHYRIKGDKGQNIEDAIACYKQALRVYTFEAFPENWAWTQYNLGIAYYDRIKGDKGQNIEDAIACYKQALRVYTFEAFPENWAMIQTNLGIAYGDRIKGEKAQNIEDAIAYYQQTLRVISFQAFPEKWAMTQNNLGIAYRNRIKGEKAQNIEEAIACYQQALRVRTFEDFPIDWAATQNNLGNAYRNRIKGETAQNIEEAIACHQQSLRVRTFEDFPIDWALTKTNLGNAYSNRIKGEKAQNIEEAITCYQQAIKVRRFEIFTVDWALTQNNLGSAYRNRIKGEKAQNIEEAITCFQKALRVRTFEAFPQYYLDTNNNLGLAYRDAQNLPEAYKAFDAAIKTVEFLRDEIIYGSGVEEYKTKLAEQYHQSYRGMVETCLALTNITEAIDYVERSKTGNLVEKILSRELKTIFPADVVTQLEQYRDEIAIGQYKIQHGKAENPTALAQHLQELRQQRNDLQDQHLPIGSSFNVDKFQNKNLDDQTAIVEFYITEDKLLTFIFTRQTEQPIVLQSEPKDFKKFQKWGNGYLRAYYNKKFHWQRRLTTLLHLLAKILHIDDIIEQIPETCDRLILIPHQYLHLLPLHALPINSQQGEGKSEILMDRFPAGVSYAPSCQLLQLAKTRERRDFTHLFAVQNPTDDLDYTNLEVEVIKSFFQAAEVLASQDAKEAAVKVNQNLTTAHCCHFSCHGYFNPESPVESALLLAEVKTKQIVQDKTTEDGFLTLGEIFGLKLEQCRLVTLSACETGLIDFKNSSDEYIGLPSAFLVAGSPAVVCSLWTVDDLSTALLMIKFYDNLLNYQMSLAVALNKAQLWLRDVTKENLLLWIKRLSIKGYQKLFLSAPLLKNDDFRDLSLSEEPFEEPYLSPSDKPFEEPYHWAAFCAIGQ